MLKRALLIYNPVAGPRDVVGDLKRICARLEHAGCAVELQVTTEPGDAARLARAAAQAGCDAVIVAGGDGTLGEAVNGLAGTPTALGVLPVGTGNVWARQLGLPVHTLTHPFRLFEAADGLLAGVVRPVDLGRLGERYFLCWAGIGLDAQVTAGMPPRSRYSRRLGLLPYVVAAFTVAGEFQGMRARLYLDNRMVRGRTLLILVSNIRQYGAIFNVASRAQVDDGLLDVFVFRGLGFSYALRHTLNILSRRHLSDPRVVYRRTRQAMVWTEPPAPVHLDGDPFTTTPVALSVAPRALRAIIPPTAPPDLFVTQAVGSDPAAEPRD